MRATIMFGAGDVARSTMELRTATAISLFLLSAAFAYANEATSSSGLDARPAASNESSHSITITRNGSRPSSKGPTEYFTGSVRRDPLSEANDASHQIIPRTEKRGSATPAGPFLKHINGK